MDGRIFDGYAAASKFLAETVAAIPNPDWGMIALDPWDLRMLVGHSNRSHTQVETYLLDPVEPEPHESPWHSAEQIAERSRLAGIALGDDPASVIAETSKRVIGIVADTPGDAPISTPDGSYVLQNYLVSRICELTIHTLDIVKATGVEVEAPQAAIEETLAALNARLVRRGDGPSVVMALSGRTPLPSSYSLY